MLKWISGTLFLLSIAQVRAQTVSEQVWTEYMGNYPFANSFNHESSFSFSTTLNSPKWSEFNYAATLEWAATQHIEPVTQLSFTSTRQTESSNTLEVRPVIGCRFYLTPSKRIQTRILARVEYRSFKNMETGEWSQAVRPRLRAEALIPINRDSYFKDKMWYGILDIEAIFTTNDLNERFANRWRLRTGLGYRLNYSVRFEFIYMYQESRNGIDDSFSSSDNIYRFRLKHYMHKSKPSQASGTGN